MATGTLGTLSIDVLANIAGMVSDLGKAQQETQKATREMQRQWQEMGNGIKDSITSIAGALGVGFSFDRILELTRASLEAAEQVDNLAQTIGASTATIQTLGYVAETSGSSVDVMTGALAKLEKSGELAASGNKQMVEAFRAIGISATEVTQLLKNPDELIKTVTQHLASFADGSGKTAVAMQLMGRAAAQSIPTINKLGSEYDELSARAKEIGIALSDTDTKALASANEGIDQLGQQVKGLANQFTIALLPAITETEESLSAFLSSPEIKTGIDFLAGGIANVVKNLQDLESVSLHLTAGGLPLYLRDAATTATSLIGQSDILREAIQKIADIIPSINFDWFARAKEGIEKFGAEVFAGILNALNDIKKGAADASAELARVFSGGTLDISGQLAANQAAWAKQAAAIQIASDATQRNLTATKENAQAQDDFGLHLAASGKAAEGATKPQIDYNAAIKEGSKTLQKLAADAVSMQDFLGGLAAKAGGPYEKAWADYGSALDKADKIAQKYVADGGDVAKAQAFIAQATNLATNALSGQIDAQAAIDRVMQAASAGYDQSIKLLTLDNEQRQIEAEYTKLMAAADKELLDVMGPLTAEQQAQLDSLHDLATAHVKTSEAIKQQRDITEEYVSIWKQGFDQLGDLIGKVFSGQIKSWKDFGSQLVNIAQQIVGSIISQFAKLAIINPILNGLFGAAAGGGSLLPTLASAGGLLGGGGGASGGTSAGGLMDMGKTIWGGFQNGFQSFMQGDSAFTMGPPDASGATSSYYGGGYQSGFGQALGVAGGVYAGYSEYQRAGGGVAGAAGGAAYGYGTYAAGAGIATVAATGSLTAGLAAIGPVGWAALALVAIDMISGGKLFGTKGKFNFGEQAINVGAGGATVSAGYDVKGQKALFGGSTHSWQTLAADPAAQKAADDFYKALKTGTESFAKQFGATMGDVVGGQFIATFDKHGNVTKTQSTVNGQTYSEDQQHFEERLGAENMLAVLDTLSKGISGAVDQYRADADQLMAVTQALAQGETMIKAGTTFLALGTDQTLTSLLALAQGMQGMGETIDQTLQRIERAQAQYDQFVGQFKPAATYASDFQAALADINNQMTANIAQANALAQAAGAEHAATQDLVNIHNYAAQQFAAAVAQLKANANSLAASLGYALPQNLDDINARIAELQGSAGTGATAINRFGASMQQAAQQPTDAMSLLLGDLSPLNDQQKWQAALQGLSKGTASAQQALEIARRLFSTGSDYNAAYAQVMQMAGHHAATTASGVVGSGTAGDPAELQELIKQRDAIMAAQQHADALKLAQEIADLASTGETIPQALADIGITNSGLADFMKELGITTTEGFNDFIQGLEKQTDSEGQTTADLAAGINQTNGLLQDILDTLGGHSTHGRGATDPRHTQAVEANTDATNNLNRTLTNPGSSSRSSRSTGQANVIQRTR